MLESVTFAFLIVVGVSAGIWGAYATKPKPPVGMHKMPAARYVRPTNTNDYL